MVACRIALSDYEELPQTYGQNILNPLLEGLMANFCLSARLYYTYFNYVHARDLQLYIYTSFETLATTLDKIVGSDHLCCKAP